MPLLHALLGVLLLASAWAQRTDRIPRNGVIGMRTSATMASDAAWYAAHRASAWAVGVAGVIALGVAGVLILGNFETARQRQIVAVGTFLVLGVVVAGGIHAHVVARRIH